jgi:hypothetical protein
MTDIEKTKIALFDLLEKEAVLMAQLKQLAELKQQAITVLARLREQEPKG